MTADVVPVTLDVSDEELMFTFSLDNWDDHVEQVNCGRPALASSVLRECMMLRTTVAAELKPCLLPLTCTPYGWHPMFQVVVVFNQQQLQMLCTLTKQSARTDMWHHCCTCTGPHVGQPSQLPSGL